MKSKFNRDNNSIELCFSFKTWCYIMPLISMWHSKRHSSYFTSLFLDEMLEADELADFRPSRPVKDFCKVVFYLDDTDLYGKKK